MKTIDKFTGEYDFLDNAYDIPVEHKGVVYRSAESAYQAERIHGSGMQGMFTSMSGKEARCVGQYVTERPNWDSIKFDMLYTITKEKFAQNPALYKRLAGTKNAHISNGFLGEILMKIRSEYEVN